MKLGLSFVLFSGWVIAADNDLPEFSSYTVPQSDAILENVDFTSHPDAINFKTRLEYVLNQSENFAGHYIVTYWGCGTMCQMVAILDVLTGDVFFPFTTSYGVCYKLDSSLLITNPVDDFLIESFGEEILDWFKAGYYAWNGQEMELLTETQMPVTEDCEAL